MAPGMSNAAAAIVAGSAQLRDGLRHCCGKLNRRRSDFDDRNGCGNDSASNGSSPG